MRRKEDSSALSGNVCGAKKLCLHNTFENEDNDEHAKGPRGMFDYQTFDKEPIEYISKVVTQIALNSSSIYSPMPKDA